MLTREQRLLLWLSYGTDGDDRLFYEILQSFADLEEAFETAEREDRIAFDDIPERVFLRLIQAAKEGFLDRYAGWLTKNGIRIITPYDDEYPIALEAEGDPPPVLFVLGMLPEGNYKAVPIELGKAQGSLPEGARVLVLASGIDRIGDILPKQTMETVLKKGAVLTPFLPKTAQTADTVEKAARIAMLLSGGDGFQEEPEETNPEPVPEKGRKRYPFSDLTDAEQQVYMAARITEPDRNALPELLGLSAEETEPAVSRLIGIGALKAVSGRLVLDESNTEITFEG